MRSEKKNNNYSSRMLCAETIKEIKVKSSSTKLRVHFLLYIIRGRTGKNRIGSVWVCEKSFIFNFIAVVITTGFVSP